MSIVTTPTQNMNDSMVISIPCIIVDCWGMSMTREKIKIANKKSNASKARSGTVGNDKILVRLMETPTKMRPVKVAAAPAEATNKSCHNSMKNCFDLKVKVHFIFFKI